MKKYLKYLYPALMILFAAVFLVSAGILVDYFIKSNKQKNLNNELANLVQQVQQENAAGNEGNADPSGEADDAAQSTYVEVTHPVTGKPMQVLREYAQIFQMNTDMVGWIKIDGTNVNYPVMQTPDYVNYYLHRDFYKEYSKHGSIYANEMANLQTPSDNVTLYGHNMNDDSMFATLHEYNDPSFYGNHAYISFDTLFEHHVYQIISVFYTTDFLDTGFAYHLFVDGTEEEFNDFVATCKDLALYETGVTATYGDKLLTLSTCDDDYADDHGRFVVVAKRIA